VVAVKKRGLLIEVRLEFAFLQLKKIFIDKNLLFLCQHVQMYILYSVEIENSISIGYLYTSQCIRHVATKATSAIPMLWIMVKGILFKAIYE